MCRKRAAIAAMALALAAAVAFQLIRSDLGPSYANLPLSVWVEILGTPEHGRRHSGAEQAIVNLGTNSIPLLCSWIAYEPQPDKCKQFAVYLIESAGLRRIG